MSRPVTEHDGFGVEVELVPGQSREDDLDQVTRLVLHFLEMAFPTDLPEKFVLTIQMRPEEQ